MYMRCVVPDPGAHFVIFHVCFWLVRANTQQTDGKKRKKISSDTTCAKLRNSDLDGKIFMAN